MQGRDLSKLTDKQSVVLMAIGLGQVTHRRTTHLLRHSQWWLGDRNVTGIVRRLQTHKLLRQTRDGLGRWRLELCKSI